MHTYSDEVKKFIEENVRGNTSTELTRMVNDNFGTNYGVNNIRAYMKNHKLRNGLDTSFKKGHTPANKGKKGICGRGCEKTWFKKGQIPSNHRPVGSERIDGKDGYILIKVAEPNKWKHKHRVIWEQHNGPIPKGYVVIFLDGDKLNLDINNLKLISRHELKILNTEGLKSNDAEITETGVLIARLICAKSNQKKKISKKN